MIMTSGYPEMTKMIREVASELKFDVTIVEGVLDEAANQVKRLVESDKYEVVISRAGTAKAIKEKIDLPVVHSDSGHFDIMQAFIRAKKFGDKICFVTYPEMGFLFNFDEIFEAVGFEVTILPYENQDELVKQIKVAKSMGMEVVVGGGRKAAKLVREHGMKSMYLTISKRTIKRALILASKVAHDRILIREKAEVLNAVINTSEEGILFINREGIIESCNPTAEKIFSVQEESIIGKRVAQISNSKLYEILNQQVIYSGKKGQLTLHNLVITYEPVFVENKKVGTVVTFQEFSKIQKLETKVRRELHAKGLVAKFNFQDIFYASDKMREVIDLAKIYAQANSTVLIIGESGTGKELIAQGIHNASKR